MYAFVRVFCLSNALQTAWLYMCVINDETDLIQFAFEWKSKVFSNEFSLLVWREESFKEIATSDPCTRNMIYSQVKMLHSHSQSELSLIDLTLAWHNLPVGISFSNGSLEYIAFACAFMYAVPFGHFQTVITIIIINTHTLNSLQRRREDVRETQYAK